MRIDEATTIRDIVDILNKNDSSLHNDIEFLFVEKDNEDSYRLIEALKENKTLRGLNLSFINFPIEEIEKIANELKKSFGEKTHLDIPNNDWGVSIVYKDDFIGIKRILIEGKLDREKRESFEKLPENFKKAQELGDRAAQLRLAAADATKASKEAWDCM